MSADRQLCIVRHAIACQGGAIEDRMQPLAAEGRRQAQRAAEFLADRLKANPVAIERCKLLASPALRTRQTADAIAAALPGPELEIEERLYRARPQTLLELIEETEESIGLLIICGHNPAVSMVAATLSGNGDIFLDRGDILAGALPRWSPEPRLASFSQHSF